MMTSSLELLVLLLIHFQNALPYKSLQCYGDLTAVYWPWVSITVDHYLVAEYCYNVSNDIDVQFIKTSYDTSTQYTILKSIYFTSNARNYDNLALDVMHISSEWNQALSSNFMLLPNGLTKNWNQLYPSIILQTSMNDNDDYVSIPDWIDFPILYYNQEILQEFGIETLPRNLTELFEIAYFIQSQRREIGFSNFWGYLFSLFSEDITCITLEFISSMNGGNIIESNGFISINNKNASLALTLMKKYFGNITDPNVLGYNEQEIMNIFLTGNALFARGWYSKSLSYVDMVSSGAKYNLLWNISRLPSYATLGTINIAINKNTEILNTSYIFDFSECITSFESSIYRWNTTQIISPYKSFLNNINSNKNYCNYLNLTYFGSNINLCSMNLSNLTETYLKLRPSYVKQVGNKYFNVSKIIQNIISDYLISDTMNSDDAVKKIEYQLQDLLYGNITTTTTLFPENKCFWDSSNSNNTLNLTQYKGNILSFINNQNPSLVYVYTPCDNSLKCDNLNVNSYLFNVSGIQCVEYLSIWQNGIIDPNYNSKFKSWQFVYSNGEKCNGFQNIFEIYWVCDFHFKNEAIIVNITKSGTCSTQMFINSSAACY